MDIKIIFLLIFIIYIPGKIKACQTLLVNSGSTVTQFSGIYYSEDPDQTPPFSYSHTECPLFLYYRSQPEPMRFWLFGKTNGGVRGAIMSLGDTSDLSEITQWLVFSPSSGEWDLAEDVNVICLSYNDTTAPPNTALYTTAFEARSTSDSATTAQSTALSSTPVTYITSSGDLAVASESTVTSTAPSTGVETTETVQITNEVETTAIRTSTGQTADVQTTESLIVTTAETTSIRTSTGPTTDVHTTESLIVTTVCPDPCDSSPCMNGGVCNSLHCDLYECTCPSGTNGDQCQCPTTFIYHLESNSCLYFADEVRGNAASGADAYCFSLDERARLVSIETELENTFITSHLACSFGKLYDVSDGMGRLNCPVLDTRTGLTADECMRSACVSSNANAYSFVEGGVCEVMRCTSLTSLTFDTSQGNFHIYIEMTISANEYRREGNDFDINSFIISNEPFQTARAFVFSVALTSDRTGVLLELTGDGTNYLGLRLTLDFATLEISSASGSSDQRVPITTDILDATFVNFAFWIQWNLEGEFSFGYGSAVGDNSLITLVDPDYSNRNSYLNRVTLSTSTDDVTRLEFNLHACNQYWTSGQRTSTTPNIFTWLATENTLSFFNWASNQPSDNTRDECIQINQDGFWSLGNCVDASCFNCEIDMT